MIYPRGYRHPLLPAHGFRKQEHQKCGSKEPGPIPVKKYAAGGLRSPDLQISKLERRKALKKRYSLAPNQLGHRSTKVHN